MSRLSAIAKRYIKPSPGIITTVSTDAEVKDIITVILQADKKSKSFTKDLAPFFKGRSQEQTLKNIWSFVRKYIRYEKDRAGHEIVKSPGKTWEDKYADCKSMSVLVGSLLKNLGYRYFYRVAFYDKKNPEQGHIYPVAILPGGEKIVVDAVHYVFNEEVEFWKAIDYDPNTGEKINAKAVAIAGPVFSPAWGLIGVLAGVAAITFIKSKECPQD